MLNLLQVSVLDNEMLESFIKGDGYKSIEYIPYDEAQEFDYAQTALVDKDKQHILYWNDNVHSNPNLFVTSFLEALKYADVEYSIEKVVMLNEDLKEYSGKSY